MRCTGRSRSTGAGLCNNLSEHESAMALIDSDFIRRLARVSAFAVARFDPTLCGKVLRIGASVSLIEFMLMISTGADVGAAFELLVPDRRSVRLHADPSFRSAGSLVMARRIFWAYLGQELSGWNISQ